MPWFLCIGLLASSFAARAEEIKINPISNATVYTKIKYNLVNRWQQETGVSHSVASLGRWSLSSNLGYTQTYDDIWTDTGWTFGRGRQPDPALPRRWVRGGG